MVVCIMQSNLDPSIHLCVSQETLDISFIEQHVARRLCNPVCWLAGPAEVDVFSAQAKRCSGPRRTSYRGQTLSSQA